MSGWHNYWRIVKIKWSMLVSERVVMLGDKGEDVVHWAKTN